MQLPILALSSKLVIIIQLMPMRGYKWPPRLVLRAKHGRERMYHLALGPGWKVYLVKEDKVYLQVSWRKATPVFQDRCHDSLPCKRVHPIRAPIYKRHRDLRRSVLAMLEDCSFLEPVLPCSFSYIWRFTHRRCRLCQQGGMCLSSIPCTYLFHGVTLLTIVHTWMLCRSSRSPDYSGTRAALTHKALHSHVLCIAMDNSETNFIRGTCLQVMQAAFQGMAGSCKRRQ